MNDIYIFSFLVSKNPKFDVGHPLFLSWWIMNVVVALFELLQLSKVSVFYIWMFVKVHANGSTKPDDIDDESEAWGCTLVVEVCQPSSLVQMEAAFG